MTEKLEELEMKLKGCKNLEIHIVRHTDFNEFACMNLPPDETKAADISRIHSILEGEMSCSLTNKQCVLHTSDKIYGDYINSAKMRYCPASEPLMSYVQIAGYQKGIQFFIRRMKTKK